jgi:NTE family protein
MKKRKKIGLALGSGAFRGLAHIGVIKALEEEHIPIDYISGASVGALIAAYYSVFGDFEMLEKEIIGQSNTYLPGISDLGFKGGLVSGHKFELMIEKLLSNYNFEHTNIPLQIVATDLTAGKSMAFSTGNLARAVRASCSMPILFEPTNFKNHQLVDGGLSDPVPVNILKETGADVVIAVNLYHKNEFIDRKFTMARIVMRSVRIAVYNLSQFSIQQADVVLAPDLSSFIQTNDFKKYFRQEIFNQLIEIGYHESKRHLPAIKKAIAR